MSAVSRITSALAGVGFVVGASSLGIFLVVALTIALFAAITALHSIVVYFVWNIAAPLVGFVPVAYQHLDFLQVWAAVAVIRIVGGVLFSGFKKDSK